MRIVLASLLVLAGCSNASRAEPDPKPSQTIAKAAPARDTGKAAAPAPKCDPDAPQSPCPIVGHWRITNVYVPGAPDPLADDRGMTGATLTVSANADAPGELRWDGPDTGQFDVSDRCTGPYLSPPGAQAAKDLSRANLSAALAAWKVKADPAAARLLGCDQGQWTVPVDPAGEWYGLVLPMGNHMALQWYENRFLLLERIP